MPGRPRHGTRTLGRAPLKFSAIFGVFRDDRPSSFERWPESKLDGLAVGIRRDVEDWARVLHNGGTPSQAQNATVGLFP
ncbi:hypothetical protein [Actinacidiphila soli]|uniref:hypothetical protein n=1 Tax=Actinacidiphila soli TaxID=2487275 RepID=UPI000FCCCFBD|nr:hypothetical protein [Actinacidiphila soli]